MQYKKLYWLFVFFLSVTLASAQDMQKERLDSFATSFITNIRSAAAVRALVSTDKQVYKAGEPVWFTVLLLNSINQRQTTKDRLLYADVVDQNDRVIKRLVLDAATQQTHARIRLPDTLATGYYWLRAYTRHMAAIDTSQIGIQPLYVTGAGSNDPHTISAPEKLEKDTPQVTFYPEGGNLITGIDNRVAVKAVDGLGKPLSIQGTIKNNRDAIVASFTTSNAGLGIFSFEPSGFRRYRAVVVINGKEAIFPLPEFDFYKGQIAVQQQAGNYKLRVLLGDSIYHTEALSYITGIWKDSLVFAAHGKGLYEVNIDKRRLPPGITSFYLFDSSFQLLSQRAVYAGAGVDVHITTDKKQYDPREKVNLTVSVTNAAGQAIPATISVSVADSLFSPPNFCNSPQSANFTATGAPFSSPLSCLDEADKEALMFTKTVQYHPPAPSLPSVPSGAANSLFTISGTVLNGKSEGSNKIVTLISSAGANGLFYTDTTDVEGRFSFVLDNLPDSMPYALEVKELSGKAADNSIRMDTPVFPNLTTPKWLKQPLALSPGKAVARLQTAYNPEYHDADAPHLPPVMVRDVKTPDYDVSKRVSTTSAILSGRDLDAKNTLDQVIMRVSGLQILNGYLVIRGLNSMRKPGPGSEPLVLVDGVQVYTSANEGVGNVSPVLSYLSLLNPRDIDFVEILKDGGAANYGVRGANGVILINTANKAREVFGNTKMKVFYAKGVSRPALFPVKTYTEKDNAATDTWDGRSTLFWNGHYLTATEDSASFQFYTSDVPATYTVTVNGVTAGGAFIHQTFQFKSK